MKIFFDKIWKKFAWILSILVILTLLIFNYFQFQGMKTTLLKEFNHEVERSSEMLSLGLSDSIWYYNTDAVTKLCNSLLADEEVAYIQVIDLDGTILFDKRQTGEAYNDEHIVHKKEYVVYNNKTIAISYFGLTYYYKNEVLGFMIQHSFIFSVFIIVMLVTLIYFLSKQMTKSLSLLSTKFEDLAHKKSSGDMAVKSNDEIAGLVKSFNYMKHALEAAEIETNELTYALEGLNSELEQKVDERTEELNTLNAELERSINTIQDTQFELLVKNDTLKETLNTLKETEQELIYNAKRVLTSQLVAGVAHEINTPIGVTLTLSTFLESIVRKIDTLYKENKLSKSHLEDFIEKLKESSRIMSINLERAATLIEGFKKVSVDQVNEIQQTFNVSEYFELVVQSMFPELKKKNTTVALTVPKDLELFTFPGALTQVLTNLMMNSMIHAFEHVEKPQISIDVTTDDKQVYIVYKDNGNGIENDISDHIFDPFFTTKRGEGGSGLGLSIIDNIVTSSLNGKISYKHLEGGAQFNIVFPKIVAGDLYA